jgi:hypothetical protein
MRRWAKATFLGTSIHVGTATASHNRVTTRLGPYEVTAQIGEGGMDI